MAPLSPFLCLCLSLFLYVRAEKNTSFEQPPLTTLSANGSSQSFPNTSSTSISDFSYIIPYGQKQECDIYGSHCQTGLVGSITVGVNLTTATTTTVLPCSAYLSAQFTYLWNQTGAGIPEQGYPIIQNGGSQLGDFNYGDPWGTNFGRSPECRSYAEAIRQGQLAFSDCGIDNTTVQTDEWDLPAIYLLQNYPGLVRYFDEGDPSDTCCGNCSLDIPEVRFYYFPDKSIGDCHNNQTFNFTSTLPASNTRIEKRMHSLVASESTVVVSGHTFTSPSMYLQLMGKATVTDQCSSINPVLTDAIITLPPGGLSTWRPEAGVYSNFGVYGNPEGIDNFTVGEVWSDPSDKFIIPQDIKSLNLQDLACPTWGLGLSTSANGDIITTIGPPWLPLIVPPKEMFTLDPTWASYCAGFWTDPYTLSTFALFDPPIALTPEALLLSTSPARPTPAPALTPADPTTVSERATPSPVAAKPASLPNNSADPPARTGDPESNSPTPSPKASDSSSKAPSVAGDPSATSLDSSSNASDPPPDDSQNSPADSKIPVVPVPQQGGNPQTQTQGLGAIIYNAFGKSGSEIEGPSILPLPSQSIFAIGAQVFTANPTGFKVDNAVISPGGTAQIVDDTTISLDRSGVLAIGSSTISLTDPSAIPVLAVAGQTFTPNPSAFSIAGTTISAGGSPVTVDGTIISLGQSGLLAIGSSTIDLLPSSRAYTVAGQTFTPNPSAFSIAGTTISADGPAVTINGTLISLKPSGTLMMGSSTIPLISQTTFSTDTNIDGFDVQAQPSYIVVDGVTLSAAAAGVTISGTLVSLEAGGATMDIGTGRFALPTVAAVGSVGVQAFTGGQCKGSEGSLVLGCGVLCGTLILLL